MNGYRFDLFEPDHREVRDLLASAGMWSDGACQHRLKAALDGSDIIEAVWAADGQLVGVARALTDGALFCLLAMLVVDPWHQGLGLGRELVSRVTARCSAGPYLTTIVLSEAEARPFYEKQGFANAQTLFLRRGA